MGLLDIATSILGSELSGGNMGGMNMGGGMPGGLGASNVLGAVLSTLNSQPGGLGGVVEQLTKGGLGNVVGQWIGNGPNPPVTPGQVQGALGDAPITDLASKLGVSPDMAGNILAQMLPHVVDHATPNGAIPAGGLSGAGFDMVKNILGGLLSH
jgi:uncharacterized protein YidB (DUF937 family)